MSENRVALVTGASRGIGRAICHKLGARGVSVVVNYRERADLARTVASELRCQGCRAIAVQADVTDEDQVADLIGATLQEFGRLDILVSNAGIWRGGRTTTLSSADWHAVLETSLTGAFFVTKHALPAMQKAGWGRIIYVSSAVAAMGWPGDAAYAAAKAGLFGLARSVAKEVALNGITVNVVAPGSTDTDMTQALTERSRQSLLDAIPLRRLGKPEEVAEMVALLAAGADYVTGQVLLVDGGISL